MPKSPAAQQQRTAPEARRRTTVVLPEQLYVASKARAVEGRETFSERVARALLNLLKQESER